MINERIKELFVKYLDNAYNIDQEIKQLIDTQDEQYTKKSLLTKLIHKQTKFAEWGAIDLQAAYRRKLKNE
ncbi:hypothetical protein BpHYR1_050078 [Brachionus plicatilis]|uniref:Uncharacterized protein n=1 Tax=Brachionus plicatilis TaxID=10195 RepID=A0A3M7PJ61_BRAPC|nr:hypothetical protein BpHYR1_050078 [Brachionus plicatilis]